MKPDREDELERLVSQYAGLIRRVVFRVAGNAAASVVDDVEQRVRIALWRQIDREQTITYPSSYIYRIAVRETVRLVREERRRETDSLDADADYAAAAGSDPHARLASGVAARAIGAALATLPVDRRRAVQSHLAGFDVRETMALFGWNYQKARNLIARGMADLRLRLREDPKG